MSEDADGHTNISPTHVGFVTNARSDNAGNPEYLPWISSPHSLIWISPVLQHHSVKLTDTI